MPEPPAKLRDTVLYLVHQIYEGVQTERADERGWVALNAQRLKRTFDNSPKGIQWLQESGIIEVNRHYQPGVRSRGFRFAGKGEFNAVQPSSKLARKIREDQARYATRPLLVHAHLHHWLGRVDFDLDKARGMDCVRVDEKRLRPGINLNNRHFTFKVDNFGRVHTPITNMKRELRSCLSINGESLTSIDIKNAQPLILCILLMGLKVVGGIGGFTRNNPIYPIDTYPNSIPVTPYDSELVLSVDKEATYDPSGSVLSDAFTPDLALYFKDVQRGDLYDSMMVAAGVPPEDRDRFKVQVFKRIFYGARGQRRKRFRGKFKHWQGAIQEWREWKGKPLGRRTRGKLARVYKVVRLFKERYPTVFEFIQKSKERTYRGFSQRMQRAESKLMIGGVCKRLMTDHPDIPVITIHDSILTTDEHVETVERLIKEEFQRYGLTPALTRKRE